MIKIVETEFHPFVEVPRYQKQQEALQGQQGAMSLFVGTMRDFNDGHRVNGMYLEHYPEMTQKQLESVVAEAESQWALLDVYLIHRVGKVLPNDALVSVAVWSVHRGDAFDACRFIMEALKSRVPFWKKELLEDASSHWVAHNTDGYHK